jgi:hypothetical protein
MPNNNKNLLVTTIWTNLRTGFFKERRLINKLKKEMTRQETRFNSSKTHRTKVRISIIRDHIIKYKGISMHFKVKTSTNRTMQERLHSTITNLSFRWKIFMKKFNIIMTETLSNKMMMRSEVSSIDSQCSISNLKTKITDLQISNKTFFLSSLRMQISIKKWVIMRVKVMNLWMRE